MAIKKKALLALIIVLATLTFTTPVSNAVTTIGGTISGYKFNDLDMDGEWDVGELGLEGWKITLLDDQGNEIAMGTTDSNGYYGFSNLLPGEYSVEETLQGGWTASTPTSQTVEIDCPSTCVLVGDPWTVPLIMGQNTHVGNLLITWDNPDLKFTYDMFDGYDLDEVHIYVGTSIPGNAPGLYNIKDEDPEEPYEYQIELTLPCGEGTYYIAAHGVHDGETIWAGVPNGNAPNPNSDWPDTPGWVAHGEGWGGYFPIIFTSETDCSDIEINFGNYETPPDTGTIIVEKWIDLGQSSQYTNMIMFEFTGDITGWLGDGEQIIETDLEPGTYMVTELNQGWTTVIAIQDPDGESTSDGAKATIDLDAGETVKVIYTNKPPDFVIPEFPLGTIGSMAVMIGALILLYRNRKISV